MHPTSSTIFGGSMSLFKSQSRLFLVSITSFQILSFASISSALNVSSNMTFNQDYYETINITADNVTLDMNGHTVRDVSGHGVNIDGHSYVTIKNGNVAYCTRAGINVTNSSQITIDAMYVYTNSEEGYKIRNSEYVQINDSYSLSSSDGFDQNYGSCTYINCFAYGNVHNGFEVDNGNGIGYMQCKSFYNGIGLTDGGRHGISISDQSAYGMVSTCNASCNGGNGFHMNTGANNFIFVSDSAQENTENGFSFNENNTNNLGNSLVSISNGQDGISLDNNSSNNQFNYCSFNSNGRDGVHIRDGSTNNSFSDCNMLSNSGDNIDNNVTGNSFINCNY